MNTRNGKRYLTVDEPTTFTGTESTKRAQTKRKYLGVGRAPLTDGVINEYVRSYQSELSNAYEARKVIKTRYVEWMENQLLAKCL